MACSWLITNERHVSQQRPASDCVFAFLEDRQKLLLGFSNRWFSLPVRMLSLPLIFCMLDIFFGPILVMQ